MLHQVVQHVRLIAIDVVRRVGWGPRIDAAQNDLVPDSELRDQASGLVFRLVRSKIREDFPVDGVSDKGALVVLPIDSLPTQMGKTQKLCNGLLRDDDFLTKDM